MRKPESLEKLPEQKIPYEVKSPDSQVDKRRLSRVDATTLNSGPLAGKSAGHSASSDLNPYNLDHNSLTIDSPPPHLQAPSGEAQWYDGSTQIRKNRNRIQPPTKGY